MNLPTGYEWLLHEEGPKILIEALHLFGTVEGKGSIDNPMILGWAKEAGIAGYEHDSIAWCGLAMAVCSKRAGYAPPAIALRARSWAAWGVATSLPMLGDILVFEREGGGHVGLYVGQDAGTFHVLGGNQSDEFKIARISKDRLVASRRSPFLHGQPPNVRVVELSPAGAPISRNEA